MKSKLFQGIAACAFAIALGGCATTPNRLSKKESPGVRYVLKTVKKAERSTPEPTPSQSDTNAPANLVSLVQWTCFFLQLAATGGKSASVC